MISELEVIILLNVTGRYGRRVAKAYQGNTDVNAGIVRQYTTDKALYDLEYYDRVHEVD